MLDTLPLLAKTDFPPIRRARLDTLQVNLGYLCNQQCLHCHVDASPRRTELMDEQNIEHVLSFLRDHELSTLDLTGGAPEMNPHFRKLVTEARAMGVHVMDRCNLTITREPGYEWLPQFLYDNDVEVVASLPCYLEENVDRQRGNGVFDGSIDAIRSLNELGYGRDGKHLLNLVYNPQGPSLPPDQVALEADYHRELEARYGIHFDNLYTITNMPIKRFGSMLMSKGQFDDYMTLLKDAHLDSNLDGVMCRTILSVDWQGYTYDCDFNQMLGLDAAGKRRHLSEMMDHDFAGDGIKILDHCYGCTAGQGSSCGGALD